AAQGIARRLAGDDAKASLLFEEALALARGTNSGLEYEARMLCELADVQVRLNLPSVALETAAVAVDTAQQRRARVTECQAQLVRGNAPLARPHAVGVTVADRALERAERLVAETGALAYEPVVQQLRARLAALTAGHH